MKKSFKISEFTKKDISSLKTKKLLYENKETFLTQLSQIELIRDSKTNKIIKILTFNKHHFNVFKLTNNNSKLKYSHSGQLQLPDLGEEVDFKYDRFFYEGLSGSGDLLWIANANKAFDRSQDYINLQPYKILWVNFSHLEKSTEKAQTEAKVLDELFLEPFQAKVKSYNLNWIRMNNPFGRSQLFIFSEYRSEESGDRDLLRRTITMDPNERPVPPHFNVKAYSAKTNRFGGSCEKLLQLPAFKLNENPRIRKKLKKDRRAFKAARREIPNLTNRSHSAIRVHHVSSTSRSYLIYTIQKINDFLALSLMNMRRRRVIKTTIVTQYELYYELWNNTEWQHSKYSLLGAFYSVHLNSLMVIIGFNRNLTVRRSNGDRDPQSSRYLILLEVSHLFNRRYRQVHSTDLSHFDYQVINERDQLILGIKIVKGMVFFTLYEFGSNERTTRHWHIMSTEENETPADDFCGNLRSAVLLDPEKILIDNFYEIFIIEIESGSILERKHYRHPSIDYSEKRLKICDQTMYLISSNEAYLELFDLVEGQKEDQIRYKGRVSTHFSNKNELFDFTQFQIFRFRNQQKHNILVKFITSDVTIPNSAQPVDRNLYLLKINTSTAEVVSRGAIKLSEIDINLRALWVLLTKDNHILVVSADQQGLRIQFINEKMELDDRNGVVEYSVVEKGRDDIKNVFIRDNKLFVCFKGKKFCEFVQTLKLKNKRRSDGRMELVRCVDPTLETGDSTVIENPCLDSKIAFFVWIDPIGYTDSQETQEAGQHLRAYDTGLELIFSINFDQLFTERPCYRSDFEVIGNRRSIIIKHLDLKLIIIDMEKKSRIKWTSDIVGGSMCWSLGSEGDRVFSFNGAGLEGFGSWESNQFWVFGLD